MFTRFPSLFLALTLLLGLSVPGDANAETRTAILAGGCFWCVEADFEKVQGVQSVESGFSGGTVRNPSYKKVVAGGTGHYEAAKIAYDPAVVSYAQLLDLFLRSVDPTDAGGQFCDRGDSYRTAIFAGTAEERGIAEAAIAKAQGELGQTIVTPVLARAAFYPADSYHQDYYKQTKIILTRFGPQSKAVAYKKYRSACGRDQRVKQLWGSAAPFAS